MTRENRRRAVVAAPPVRLRDHGRRGSSGTGPVTAANAPDEDVYQCEEDAPTGSHMRAKECRSRAQKKEEKRSAEELLHKPQQGPGAQ
ncbi:MAG: hypothetical protein QM765_21660 [Myxococcales bacterium]